MHFNRRWYIISTIIILISAGVCTAFISWKSNHVSNVSQFNSWLNDETHQCIISRRISGVNVSVKYQPPSYITMKDIGGNGLAKRQHQVYDSLMQTQEQLLTFLMTIGPDKSIDQKMRSASIMYEGVNEYKQYIQRVLSTNFMMDQYLCLYIDGVKYKPVLCLMENLYELSDDRNFIVVFASEKANELINGKDYLFEYDDPFFQMGKVQFDFSGVSLSAARDVKVVWN